MKDKEFDFEVFKKDAIGKLQVGEGLLGEGGAFTELLKSFLEETSKGRNPKGMGRKKSYSRHYHYRQTNESERVSIDGGRLPANQVKLTNRRIGERGRVSTDDSLTK